MNAESYFLFGFFIFSLIAIAFGLGICVWFVRWLLGVHKIWDSLDNIQSLLQQLTKNQRCEVCETLWAMSELKKIESGQYLCPDCIEAMGKKG